MTRPDMQTTKPAKPRAASALAVSSIVHPPSPESTTVDLTKVRAYAACKSCRAKKVKCLPGSSTNDGAPGQCQQCQASHTECTYPPTRDRAAYSRQYVQNLESRVQALENLSMRMVPVLDAYERGNGGTTGSATPLPGSSVLTGKGDLPKLLGSPPMHGRGMDEEAADEDDGARSSPSPSEPDDGGQIAQDERGNYRWIGSSNTLSLLDSFSHNRSPHEPTPPTGTAHDPGRNPYFGHVAGSGVVKALPGVDEVSYPNSGRAAEYVDAFFRDIYPVLPVVDERLFRAEYREMMDRKARGQPEKPGGFISVVFAIFALGERVMITSRAWQRERNKIHNGSAVFGTETVMEGEAEAGVIWYERAQILHYTTLKDVNIHQVQCLTLLAAFQASVNAMPMSWLLAGQAIRVAQDLGLHRSTARMRMSFVEKQIRARCWWALYGLERIVSAQLGRPLGVDDLDIDVALPVPIDDATLATIPKTQYESPDLGEEPHASTISGFIALTKLCKIAGRVAVLLYRPSNGRSTSDPSWAVSQQNTINKLDKTLKDWLEKDVPAKYKDPSSTARSVQLVSAVLSNAYFAVLLTLHRNFLPSNPDYPRPRPPSNSQSLSQLVEAARSVIHVAAQQRVLLPPSHHLAAACHNLWSSAIILLLCEVQARDQVVVESVGSSVESCRQTLQTLEPAWPGSRKLKDLLHEVEQRTKEAAASGMQPGAGQRKKRKSSQPDIAPQPKRTASSSMLPPSSTASPRPGQNWSYNSRGTSASHGSGYQTSDTRTLVEDDLNTKQSNRFGSTQITPPTTSQPMLGTIDTSQLFDIGGVTFDGLEMLQGFDFNSMAGDTSFWNSFISPTAGAQYIMSGQNTPGSGSGNGPSPSAWALNDLTNQGGQGSRPGTAGAGVGAGVNGAGQGGAAGAGGGAGGGMGIDLAGSGLDFWSQVAPSSGYDWAADPNVPFGI